MTAGTTAAAPGALPAHADVVVIGSGIVGLGAALAAVDRGKSVLVVDRADDITGATVRNFGHLCFTPQSGRARDYALTARRLWLRLADEAGFPILAAGTLVVARHDDEMRLLARLAHERSVLAPDAPTEVELLRADEIERLAALPPRTAVGGAHLPLDLQVDPRRAAHAIRAYLETRGVIFRMRTAATTVSTGLVQTTRGVVRAGLVVVATGHDIDQLLPGLAERHGVVRCGLDMLRVAAELPGPLAGPLLTGWSLTRYRAFAELPEAAEVRARLAAARPDLAAIDLNQMYTQRPDGTLIVGDSHFRGASISPFQDEAVASALLAEFRALFGSDPTVVERWQGVYASGPDEFVVEEVEPGVLVTLVTTGIGMTTGLGLAEHTLAEHLGTSRIPATESKESTLA